MRHKKYLFAAASALSLSLLLFVLEAGAQCPGPTQRTALLNLQRANVEEGTRAGQIALTDTCGNQRYAQYVEINLDTIGYTPTTTGNTLNLSEFVFDPTGALWYIDWQGNGVQFAAGGGECDQDWLEIGPASCPDNINDSIYTYKYAAVGARYVWPGATFLVNDSTNLDGALMVVQGDRQVKIALYDITNESFGMIHQNSNTTSVLVQQDGSFLVSTASGAPDSVTLEVSHFSVNTVDSTIQMYQYPNTRRDTQAVANFLYTDDFGVVRSQSVDSLPYPAPVNIYNSNGVINQERIISLGTGIGSLEIYKNKPGAGLSTLYIGDTVVYANAGGSGFSSIYECIPRWVNFAAYAGSWESRGFITAYSAELYSGKTSKNSQVYVDTIGVKIKTQNTFGTAGQVLRNVGGYAQWQDTTAAGASVNIYNSNGTISTNRTATLADTILWDIGTSAAAFQIEGINNSAFRVSDNAVNIESGGAALNLGSGTPVAVSLALDAGTARITDNRGTKSGLEYGSAGYGAQFTDSTLVHRSYVGKMISDSLSAAPGGGDVLQNGNSFGASMLIGTNDNNTLSFETNTVTRSMVSSGASTGGAWTNTDVSANTNTVETMFNNIVNSSGTAATGFGLRHIYALESSTTDGQTAAAMDAVWSDATHASRTGDFVFSTVASGAALAELFRMGGTNYALTATASVSNTNTVADRFTIRTNSSGTAAANFGGGILFQGESTTTDNQDMGRISSYWTTATHANREAALSFQLGDAGGALAEIVKIDRASAATGAISVGSTTPVIIQNSGITPGTNYTIGNNSNLITIGGSTGGVVVSSSNTTGINIHNTFNSATATQGIVFGNATSFTQTSGIRNYLDVNYSFAPTSGTAINNGLVFSGTLNQTGGANGIVRDIYLNRTVTAVSAYRGIEIAYSNANSKGIYQTGASTTNNFVGATGFGATTTPTDKLEVTGNLALLTAGNKIKIATGSNASIGTSTLIAGTVTVSTTAVTSSSKIFLTCAVTGGTLGFLSVGTITNGTSFVINSSSVLDTSQINWFIIN
jgi:hypothetical protein